MEYPKHGRHNPFIWDEHASKQYLGKIAREIWAEWTDPDPLFERVRQALRSGMVRDVHGIPLKPSEYVPVDTSDPGSEYWDDDPWIYCWRCDFGEYEYDDVCAGQEAHWGCGYCRKVTRPHGWTFCFDECYGREGWGTGTAWRVSCRPSRTGDMDFGKLSGNNDVVRLREISADGLYDALLEQMVLEVMKA